MMKICSGYVYFLFSSNELHITKRQWVWCVRLGVWGCLCVGPPGSLSGLRMSKKWGWRKCGDTKCLRGATVSCVPAGQATGTKVSEGHTHVRVPHGQHRFTQALKTRSFIFVCGWRRCDYTSGCEENCHEGCGVGQARKVFSSAVLMSNKVSPAPRC